jgi:hypothetical protein
MHDGQQLPGREWLSKAGRGACLGSHGKIIQDGIHRVSKYETRHRHYRYCRRSPAKFSDGLKTADIWQKYIDYSQVKAGRFKGFNPDAGIARMHGVAAFAIQHHPDSRADRYIVLDDKHPRHGRRTLP